MRCSRLASVAGLLEPLDLPGEVGCFYFQPGGQLAGADRAGLGELLQDHHGGPVQRHRGHGPDQVMAPGPGDQVADPGDRPQDLGGIRGIRGIRGGRGWRRVLGPHLDNPSHYVKLAEAATLRAAATGREQAAKWGLVLRVYWAGREGPQVFDRLLRAEPSLGQSELVGLIAQGLADHGYIAL